MSKISNERIISLGEITRIAVTEEDAQTFSPYFENNIALAEKFAEVNTENVKQTTHGITLLNVMREDIPNNGLTEEEVFKNAPEPSEKGQFRVPAIME